MLAAIAGMSLYSRRQLCKWQLVTSCIWLQKNLYILRLLTLVEVQPTVTKCPNCGNDMTLRKRNPTDQLTQQTQATAARRGGYFIGCMGYPQCRSAIWLPREMLEVSVLNDSCQRVSIIYSIFVYTFSNLSRCLSQYID